MNNMPNQDEQINETSEIVSEETNAEFNAENSVEVGQQNSTKKVSIIKKWWFWLALVAVVVAIIAIISATSDSDSGSSSGGSSYTSSYTDTYVLMVKNARHSTYGITYGRAFDSFFSNTSWESFLSSEYQRVVEFEGMFYYDGSPAIAKVQFLLDLSEGSFTVHYLSINGVSQSRLMLSALIKKVFESY